MGAEPVDARWPVVVGRPDDVWEWARQQSCTIVTRPDQLHQLSAGNVHILLLPSWRELPQFLLMQVEIMFLERKGATVEELYA